MALRSNVARLRDMLLKAKLVDEFQMKAAMGRLEQWGGRLTGIIVDMGFCDDEALTTALSQLMRVPVMHLGMVQKDQQLLSKLGVEFCEEHGVFPVSLQNRVATIAFSDPTEIDTVDAIAAKLNARVQVVIASEGEVKAAIAKHFRGQSVPATRPRGRGYEAPTGGAGQQSPAQSMEQSFSLDTREPPKPGSEPDFVPGQRSDWMSKPPSANTMLDEFLDDEPAKTDGFTAEEVARLETVKVNQAKAGAILRALQQLLTEKGYLR
jgi:hypothetical protein